MCGICGIINFNKKSVAESSIRAMMRKIKHRGPDDEGIYLDGNLGIGFVRLSILDLSELGHQPMFDTFGRYLIIHNGEIYNYIEIKQELISKGYVFKSNTDTEVILNSYIEWGEECLNKFNGMWAFAIYDNQRKKLFFSRDRYGIKPFYYYVDDEQFIFASEISAIKKVLRYKPVANNQEIFNFLVYNRTDYSEKTFFKDINKLQHGFCLSIELNMGNKGYNEKMAIDGWKPLQKNSRVYRRKWYDLKKQVNISKPFNGSDEYKDIFKSAIGLRLRSDVPVGVCLSGGLDSSSIASVLLQDFHKTDLNTFSAVYDPSQTCDESQYINEYCDLVKRMHFTTPSAENFFDDIPSFIKTHAEPLPSTSTYAQYKVMELASRHVVVTLDGQGADESLAGYHYFFGFYLKQLLKNFHLLKLNSEIINYLRNHKTLYGLKTATFFLLPNKIQKKIQINNRTYINKEFVETYVNGSVVYDKLYDTNSLQNFLINHFELKLEHLLKREDHNSMHFSLESRVPFLDHRLVEKTLALPDKYKIKKGVTKYILRQAMKGMLPEKIRLRQDKVGFTTPEAEWFMDKRFQIFFKDIINSSSFKGRGIISPSTVADLYKKHLNKKINFSTEIWKIIHLELWFREFID